MTFQWRPILRVIVENKNGLFFRPTRHLLAFSNFALGWHHRFLVVNLFLIMQMKDDYSECVDNNHLKDTCHLTTIILYLSSEKIVQKNFRKMFSKFKIEKPQNVLYRRGPRHFEAEQSIISLSLLEAFDAGIRNRQEMTNCEPATWWKIWNWRKRGLKFFSSARNCNFFEKKLLEAVWRWILSNTRWSSMLVAKATGTLTSLRAL